MFIDSVKMDEEVHKINTWGTKMYKCEEENKLKGASMLLTDPRT